ncbi:MAG: diaminopimelate epimerase [Candidatus Bathyarchaeia archaeon]
MAELSFWKMHGLGNDYIVIDNREGALGEDEYPSFARKVCRRRLSIGADGVIAVCRAVSPDADFRMRIFNPDGSEAEMCGNGIRCLARYVYEKGLIKSTEIRVETLSGVRTVAVEEEGGSVGAVTVDMGAPQFDRPKIPMLGKGTFIDQSLPVGGSSVKASCLSMGNPHCVIFADDLEAAPVESLGPLIEAHSLFPQRVNVEFVKVIDRRSLGVRTWERGVGETLACGTGACASVVAGALNKLTSREVLVHLPGGDLQIEWLGDGRVLMTGPATEVFVGEIDI